MADVGKTMKEILAKSVKAINTTANHVATSTKTKMDEMSMTSRRKELQTQAGQHLLELWKNGATVPSEIQGTLAEMNQLDEQLKLLRENRKAAKEEKKAEKQAKKAEKKAEKKAQKKADTKSEQPVDNTPNEQPVENAEPFFDPQLEKVKDDMVSRNSMDAPTMEMPTVADDFAQPEAVEKPDVPTLDFMSEDNDKAE